MSWETVLSVMLGVILGGIVSALISRHYARESAAQLEAETRKLQRLHHILLNALEDNGIVEFARDSAGKVNGNVYRVWPEGAFLTLTASGEARVISPGEPEYESLLAKGPKQSAGSATT